MKKHYKILILFILIPFLGFSNDDTFISKQKSIKKTYIVNSNAGIDIDNKYGNISVSTWDEDKIDLDITIKVTGGNENWVNERLNSIDVDITALKSMVTAVTNMGNSTSKSRGSNNSFEINYVIKIPKNGTVKLLNKYGNISTLNLDSTTDITCKYGKVALGKLNGNSNKLVIEYCQNSTADYIKNSTIVARYSNLKLNDAENINLDASYSDLNVGDSQNVKYDCNYGNIKLQKVNSFSGSASYLNIVIGELTSNLNSELRYSKLNVGNITEKAGNINVTAGYSDVYLGFSPNFSFDFDITTKYGSIKASDDLEISVSEVKSNTKTISGFYKRKGQNKVAVNSNYGNVTLTKK